MPTASACSSRPATSSSISRAATTSRTTPPCCRATIASFKAFENAMTLDIAMGGSTNTVLHLLAAAHEGGGPLHHGRYRPAVAPRAGALQGGAVGRRTCIWRTCTAPAASWPFWASSTAPACSTASCRPCTARRWSDALDRWDIKPHQERERAQVLHRAAPGGVPTQVAFSQERRFDELDPDRDDGRDPRRRACLLARMAAWPCSTATSREDGCIVKTAGVDASILKFAGPARVFESQDAAVEGILGDKVKRRRRRA